MRKVQLITVWTLKGSFAALRTGRHSTKDAQDGISLAVADSHKALFTFAIPIGEALYILWPNVVPSSQSRLQSNNMHSRYAK